MIYFGIDPGTSVTGYGIVSSRDNTVSYVDSGIIRTKSKMDLPQKLEMIYDRLLGKMTTIIPDYVSVEQAFYAKNVNTTLVLGHARGVAILAARKSGAQVVEFTPREIKKAVVGNGNAAKDQVEYMVKMLLRLPVRKTESDEYDALAAALCAFNNRNVPTRK